MSEWIPIRTQLHKQPKVLRLASLTHRQPAEVVGLLVAFWGWMSEVSADGQVEGVGAEDLAVAAGGDAAFWEAAQAVGWLQITPRGIAMPGFDQWLSRGAKRRIQEVRRRQEERDENPPKGVADRILTASCPHPDRILSASNADDLRSKGGLYNSTSQDIIPPPTPALLKAGGVGVEAAPPEP